MADFVATETQRQALFTHGVVAFEVPLPGLRGVSGRREALIDDFLADRVNGALCIELLGGPRNADADANAFVRGWVADHDGLEIRHDQPGTPKDFYEVLGPYSALKALKDAVLAEELELFQAWFYHDAGLPGVVVPDPRGVDPLAAYLVDVFEQFYGELDEGERASLLARPECRIQLYDEGCFIGLHQDGVETVRRQGVELAKQCVVLCYLSSDWREGAGGQLECIVDVPRDLVLGDASAERDWSGREHVWAAPRLGTFVILDFTKFNIPHVVHRVTDDRFMRKMFGWSFATGSRGPAPLKM